MSRLPLYGLAALAALLAVSIAWQLSTPDRVTPAAPLPITAATTDARPPTDHARGAADLAAVILARPLFSPARRAAAPGMVAQPAPDGPLPRLTGIIVTPTGRSAIFAGGAQPVVVLEGGQLGGFVVHAIEPGQVTLLGPDGPRIVLPSFDPNRPQPVAAAVAQGLPLLPGAARPAPAYSPEPPEGSKDAMPFEQKPAPTGLDIVRNQSSRAPGQAGPPR